MSITKVESEVNGRLEAVYFQVGDAVAANDVLAVVESMKMEISLVSPVAGTVSAVLVTPGQVVEEGQVLFEIG